jgi:hypothetical protein
MVCIRLNTREMLVNFSNDVAILQIIRKQQAIELDFIQKKEL